MLSGARSTLICVPQVTQVGFVRDITKAAYSQGQKKPSTKTMNDFMWKKGPRTGNTSAVFYAAYVFFEKLRIRDEKPKTKFREEMESVQKKENGFDVEYPSSRGRWCGVNGAVMEDQYGKVHFVRRR